MAVEKIDYYSLLKTKGDADVLCIPIRALKLPSSITNYLTTTKIQNPYGRISTLSTIGDLINYGKPSVMALLSSKNMRYEDLREYTYQIEESLAKLGFKMKDSEFTVGDVRVNNLELRKPAANLLSKYNFMIKTLDDLIIIGPNKMYKMMQNTDLATMIDIYKALEKYGLKMEESPYRIKPERFFPLISFASYLPKEKQKELKLLESERNNAKITNKKLIYLLLQKRSF